MASLQKHLFWAFIFKSALLFWPAGLRICVGLFTQTTFPDFIARLFSKTYYRSKNNGIFKQHTSPTRHTATVLAQASNLTSAETKVILKWDKKAHSSSSYSVISDAVMFGMMGKETMWQTFLVENALSTETVHIVHMSVGWLMRDNSLFFCFLNLTGLWILT